MKVFIYTLGCKVNQADSVELMARILSDGDEVVEDISLANVCIVNTCTVTAKADLQCRNAIRHLRRSNPSAKIIVTGCYANVAGDELRQMPEVDEVKKTSSFVERQTHHERGREITTTRARAQLKIQDGCDRFCAYCIVPYARGRSRSLPVEDVLRRIDDLHKAGYAEIVLTGIHLGGYGHDLNPPATLYSLLTNILTYQHTNIPFRIRLSSIDPDEWTPELVNFVASSKMICPHFHIPLQSGSDDILKAMGRRYTIDGYQQLVSELKLKIPGCAIGSDVIVGFPGETDAHFEKTRFFIEALSVDYLHVFPYSKRRLTAAADLKGAVTNAEKNRRVKILMDISREKRLKFYAKQVGRNLDIVIELRRDKKTGKLKGMSQNYVPVFMDGNDNLMGKLVTIRGVQNEIDWR